MCTKTLILGLFVSLAFAIPGAAQTKAGDPELAPGNWRTEFLIPQIGMNGRTLYPGDSFVPGAPFNLGSSFDPSDNFSTIDEFEPSDKLGPIDRFEPDDKFSPVGSFRPRDTLSHDNKFDPSSIFGRLR